MNSKRLIVVGYWAGALAGLICIVLFYRAVLHANLTTIALTFLLYILFLASRWGLRSAIIVSFLAGFCYNYFFLPPVGHFTISDPQNILALITFLVTSVVASRMSERIRNESKVFRCREVELETLYRLSRSLLQNDEFITLTNSIPGAVLSATQASAALFYLLNGNRIYRAGQDSQIRLSENELRDLSHAPGIISSAAEQEAMIPLRTGVRPKGVLIIRGTELSHRSLDALGGLISIALERSSAIQEVTSAESARESERLRGLMLDSITQDLTQPIRFIRDTTQAMIKDSVAADARLMSVYTETKHLSDLVSRAIEMANLDTQELHISLEAQSADDLLKEALALNEEVLSNHPVTVTVAPLLPQVMVDRVWIQKLLAHLIENAVRYSLPDGPITLSAYQSENLIFCSIADRGTGIEPLEQGLIFDKFFRATKRSNDGPGIGLGLAICRAIIEAHGGTISVTSQPGYGSVFTFSLQCHIEAGLYVSNAKT